MEQPESFEVKSNEGNQVYCKLPKCLYRPKQSGRNWHLTLMMFLERVGIRGCIIDKCLFVRGTGDELCVVCVWVDDMLYWGRQDSFVEWFEKKAKNKLK